MTSEVRLLLIDDHPEERALAAVVLSAALPGARIDQVDEGALGLSSALEQGPYDLVVTDLGTQWARGTFLLRVIRSHQPQAAVVVFTHTEDRESAVAAMKAGAADYVVKSSAGFLQLGRSVVAALGGALSSRVSTDRAASDQMSSDQMSSDRTSSGRVSGSRAESPGDDGVDPVAATKGVSTQRDEGAVDPEPPAAGNEPPETAVIAADLAAVKPVEIPVEMPVEIPVEMPVEEPTETAAIAHPRLYSAVEGARRSVAAVPGRSMGAVLGMIAILAVFSLLYASFFSGRSDSVEAGAVRATGTEAAAAPPATDRTADLDGATGSPPPALVPASAPEQVVPAVIQAAVADESPEAAEMPSTAQPSLAVPVFVRLVATAEVWVQGTTDGESVLDRVLQPGEVVELGGLESATLVIGNAAGLSVSWNGRDLGDLGTQGQVRRLYFTPDRVGAGSLPTG